MPDSVDLTDGSSIEKANGFINILTKWENVSLGDWKQWQDSVNKLGSRVDIKSDDWMMGVLKKSMESDLKAEISFDMNMEHIPIH